MHGNDTHHCVGHPQKLISGIEHDCVNNCTFNQWRRVGEGSAPGVTLKGGDTSRATQLKKEHLSSSTGCEVMIFCVI